MTVDAERESRDHDIAAFMALPRVWLYGGAAVSLAVFLGAAYAVMMLAGTLGLWLAPTVTAGVAVLVAILRQSSAGRGALWTLAGTRFGPRAPRHTNLIWVVLTVALLTVPVYFQFLAP